MDPKKHKEFYTCVALMLCFLTVSLGFHTVLSIYGQGTHPYNNLGSSDQGDITVISPSGGDKLEELNSYMIEWTNETPIPYVDVGLYKGSYEDSTFLGYMEYGVENIGHYNWTVGIYEDDTDYYINVSNYEDSSSYGLSDYFAIKEWQDNEIIEIPGFNLYIMATLLVVLIGISSLFLHKKIKSK